MILGLPLAGRQLPAITVRLDPFDNVLVEPFVPNGAVVALDTGVLLGLSGLDMLDGNPMFLGPFRQLSTDVFRAIVHPNGAGLSAPFNDAVKAPDDSFGGQAKIDLDAQTFAVEVPSCLMI